MNCSILWIYQRADQGAFSILLLDAEDISEVSTRVIRLLDHLDQMLEDQGFEFKALA